MFSLITLTIFSGLILSSSSVSADDVVDIINIAVPVSCTISGTGMNTHNAEIQNGTYQANIGTTTLHAFCNDSNGFAIYAAGYTGDEIGETNSNKLVGTSASSNAAIDTGLATSAGNPDVSNWAMKLAITQDSGDTSSTNAFTIDSAPNTSGGADASFSQYHTVPNEYVKVAHKNSATDMTANTGGVKLTTTYAAYISKTQPADTYTGKVIYTLVHPATAPAPGPKSINTATTMQEVTFCDSTLTAGQVYTLTDERDNQQYKVARLADGNCWMLDNLALDPTDPTTAANMNASNTNASAEAITNLLNGGNAGSNAGWSSTAVADVDTNFGTGGYVVPRINNASKDTVVTSYGAGSGKVGIYYNYCAASASTYCYANNAGVDLPNTDIDAPQDICPANWRMPTGGDYDDSTQTGSGEYYTLGTALGLTFDEDEWGFPGTTYQTALSTPLSGYYNGSSASDHGSYGYWWSSTYGSGSGMYRLDAGSSYVYPTSGVVRYNGNTMRCLMGD